MDNLADLIITIPLGVHIPASIGTVDKVSKKNTSKKSPNDVRYSGCRVGTLVI